MINAFGITANQLHGCLCLYRITSVDFSFFCFRLTPVRDQKTIDYFLEAHEKVLQSGKFNYQDCKIKVNHRMNFEILREYLKDYKNNYLYDRLEFGFPIGYHRDETILKKGDRKKIWKHKNHKGAVEYPQAMLDYLEKEAENKSILGPFKNNPFKTNLKINLR